MVPSKRKCAGHRWRQEVGSTPMRTGLRKPGTAEPLTHTITTTARARRNRFMDELLWEIFRASIDLVPPGLQQALQIDPSPPSPLSLLVLTRPNLSPS